jgi:hypothetical protein
MGLPSKRLRNSIFQEVTEEITENWNGGVLVGGMALWSGEEPIARAYKQAGDVLVKEALENDLAHEFTYPILFVYRHTIELYLKTILNPTQRNHNLESLIQALVDYIDSKYKQPLESCVVERLREFATFDPSSTTFRYSSGHLKSEKLYSETWVDLTNLSQVMDMLCKCFEQILHS